MREVILGIKDYLNDVWHDMRLRHEIKHPETEKRKWVIDHYECFWKEGSVWYYIRQRRIAKKMKALRGKK